MIIARRILSLSTPEGPQPVEVLLHLPVEEKHGVVSCRVVISGLSLPVDCPIYGFDSVQAIQLAMFHVGNRLEVTDEHREGRLSFEGKAGDYDFPGLIRYESDDG